MANKTSTGAPPWAVPCWVDNHTLYFELRGLDGPVVVSFRRHELAKALATLFTKWETESHGEVYIRPNYVAKDLAKAGVTQSDLDAAAKALREMGLLK